MNRMARQFSPLVSIRKRSSTVWSTLPPPPAPYQHWPPARNGGYSPQADGYTLTTCERWSFHRLTSLLSCPLHQPLLRHRNQLQRNTRKSQYSPLPDSICLLSWSLSPQPSTLARIRSSSCHRLRNIITFPPRARRRGAGILFPRRTRSNSKRRFIVGVLTYRKGRGPSF